MYGKDYQINIYINIIVHILLFDKNITKPTVNVYSEKSRAIKIHVFWKRYNLEHR
jgi:hypothetical protein